jgi:biotin synthase-like enzyme
MDNRVAESTHVAVTPGAMETFPRWSLKHLQFPDGSTAKHLFVSVLQGLKDIAITTNGITLHRNLEALRDAGLNLVNISLDTLQPEKFEVLTRQGGCLGYCG